MVAMVITRVVSVVPRLLSWECAGLLSLCAAALFVQLKAEQAVHQFKIQRLNPRPGSSSGIFLGALTLPTVMLSRLIQLQRRILAHGSESPALETLRLHFGLLVHAAWVCFLSLFLFYGIPVEEEITVLRRRGYKFLSLALLLWLLLVYNFPFH